MWSYLLCVVLDSAISWLVNIMWSYLICVDDVDKPWYNWIKVYTEQIRPHDVDKPWYSWVKDYTEQIRPQDVDKAWYRCGLICSVVLDSAISCLVNILWSYLLCVVLDSVISWWEQSRWDGVHFVIDQHVKLDFYSASSLKRVCG
jgi:hypothetical protein